MLRHSQRHRFLAGATAISSLCAHHTLLLMALPEGPAPKAFWTDIETREFVDFLYEKRSEGDGAGNFKMPTYNTAADHIAPHLSQGPAKTGAMCRTKWTTVRLSIFV